MYESDQDLIDACRQGDSQAWDWLLSKYERLVFSIPLNYGLSPEDAADIAQITFTILIQSLETLLEDSHLGPWLATVARRHTWRILAQRRREAINPHIDLSETLFWITDEAGSQAIERWEMLEWLDQGVAQLNDNCRALLLALYFEPQPASYAAIADKLALPLGSIGPMRARCLQRLKQILLEQSKVW